MEAIQALVGRISAVIINPIIALLFGVGMVVFIYGLIEFLWSANIKGEPNNEGKKHMFWGIIGMFIMIAVFAIIRIIANTIQVQLPAGY